MAVKLTPEQWAAKQARNLKNSVEDIRIGVNAVTQAPGAKAAAKSDKWLQRISDPNTVAKWRANTAGVTLDDWKGKMLNKGLSRIGPGIDAAVEKVTDFASQVTPHINSGLSALEKMPDLTLQDSISRATYWIEHMSRFSKK